MFLATVLSLILRNEFLANHELNAPCMRSTHNLLDSQKCFAPSISRVVLSRKWSQGEVEMTSTAVLHGWLTSWYSYVWLHGVMTWCRKLSLNVWLRILFPQNHKAKICKKPYLMVIEKEENTRVELHTQIFYLKENRLLKFSEGRNHLFEAKQCFLF